ncbi:MAG: hypothetical protein ACI9MR_002703 [Myxococcota bacterium]
MVGLTGSADFPTKNPLYAWKGGSTSSGDGATDALLVGMDLKSVFQTGSLKFAMLLGDTGFDEANAVDISAAGIIAVGGSTGTSDFPMGTTAGIRPTYRGGFTDGYIALFSVDAIDQVARLLGHSPARTRGA